MLHLPSFGLPSCLRCPVQRCLTTGHLCLAACKTPQTPRFARQSARGIALRPVLTTQACGLNTWMCFRMLWASWPLMVTGHSLLPWRASVGSVERREAGGQVFMELEQGGGKRGFRSTGIDISTHQALCSRMMQPRCTSVHRHSRGSFLLGPVP